MKRLEFLKLAATGAAVGLGQLALSACKSTSSPTMPLTSKTFTSSVDGNPGHSHTIDIAQSEINSPPAAGISRATSVYSGHSHTFTMTQADLTTVMGGGTVTVVTSTEAPVYNIVHSHTFMISKWYVAQRSFLNF